MASGGNVGLSRFNAARNRGTSTTSPLVSRPINPGVTRLAGNVCLGRRPGHLPTKLRE
jgi:hypothetical protein